MNLNETLAERSTLQIAAIVDHLTRYFGIPPHARELALVLGNGTEACPRDALRHWVMEQCRALVGQSLEFPLKTIEQRLFDHLEEHGYDLNELDLPSPAARRLTAPLPDPDRNSGLAHRLRERLNEPKSSRLK